MTLHPTFSVFFAALWLGACTPITTPLHTTTPSRYHATVTHIADGDTIRVSDQQGNVHKIRLAFIDAPELKQNHGVESQNALHQHLTGQNVEVDVVDIDRYKREVARIWLKGKDINLLQIQNGNAWHYQSIAKRNQSKNDFVRYQAAQTEAQNKQRGLWQDPQALAPWTYRQQQRKQKAPL